VLAEVTEACQGADAIVHSLLLGIPGHEIALRQGIPDFAGSVFPVFAPTGAFPCPPFPHLPLGAWYNVLTHVLFNQSAWQASRLAYGMVRRKHPELPPLTEWPFRQSGAGRRTPILYGISPQVVPRPPDWGEHVHLTGYWFLNEGQGWTPPADLQTFLEAGPPPVYLGFGSTVSQDTARLTEALCRR
jgi:sterol 3beta-glucosyltransferase